MCDEHDVSSSLGDGLVVQLGRLALDDSLLQRADLGNDPVHPCRHFLCALAGKLLRLFWVVGCPLCPDVPARVLRPDLVRLEPFVCAIVPFATVLDRLDGHDLVPLVLGEVRHHELQCALAPAPRTAEDVANVARVHHLAAVTRDKRRRELPHHVLAVLRQWDVGPARVLARDGPLGLAVPSQNHAGHRRCHRDQ